MELFTEDDILMACMIDKKIYRNINEFLVERTLDDLLKLFSNCYNSDYYEFVPSLHKFMLTDKRLFGSSIPTISSIEYLDRYDDYLDFGMGYGCWSTVLKLMGKRVVSLDLPGTKTDNKLIEITNKIPIGLYTLLLAMPEQTLQDISFLDLNWKTIIIVTPLYKLKKYQQKQILNDINIHEAYGGHLEDIEIWFNKLKEWNLVSIDIVPIEVDGFHGRGLFMVFHTSS